MGTRVAADPIEENIVYVTLSGYRWDEYQPHVFVSNDYGNNWTDISSNLPESPVNDIIISPNDNSVIFVATDMGVYVTYNQGESWQVLGDNLPNVVVDDLVYHQPTNKLLAATYGRSMYTYDLEQDPQTFVHENKTDMSAVVYPNPFSDKTTISVKGIHHPENIFIYNLTGKLVTVLQIGANGSAIWNGRNRQGMKVNKGAYFCRIQSGGQFISKKIILQ